MHCCLGYCDSGWNHKRVRWPAQQDTKATATPRIWGLYYWNFILILLSFSYPNRSANKHSRDSWITIHCSGCRYWLHASYLPCWGKQAARSGAGGSKTRQERLENEVSYCLLVGWLIYWKVYFNKFSDSARTWQINQDLTCLARPSLPVVRL